MTDNGVIVTCSSCAKRNRVTNFEKKNVCGNCGNELEIKGEVTELTGQGFDSFLASEPAAVVDFWASWCGPCVRMAPIFAETAERNPAVAFGKLDTEANQALAAKFRVESIPTLIFFKEGEEAERLTGFSDRARIEQGIRSWL